MTSSSFIVGALRGVRRSCLRTRPRDTLRQNPTTDRGEAGQVTTDHSEEPASSSDTAFWIAVIFVGAGIVFALLFTIYVLAWDGGAHT